jgi:hypothetical protein
MSDTSLPSSDDLFPDPLVDIAAELRLDEDQGPGREGRWQIEDELAAEWAMLKLAEAQDRISAVVESTTAYVERAQELLRRKTAEDRRTVEFMAEQLQDYALRCRAAGKGATVTLPSGTVRTQKGRGETIQISDPKAVVKWARANHPGILSSVTVTDLREIAAISHGKVIDPVSGEVIPGTYVEPEGEPTAAAPKPL